MVIFHEIICCGDLLESPHRGDSNRLPQHMILRRTNDNYAKKISENLVYCKGAPGRFASKQVPPGTIPPGHFAQNFERDCSLQSSGTIRSKTNLRVDSPIFIINMYIH